jgi:hypothetical protein
MTLVSGKEFNEMNPDTTFYKLLNKNLTHFGFYYKHGINTDTVPFNPSGECSEGGLYFTDQENIPFWLEYNFIFRWYMCKVTIPNHAKVFIENCKYKTDVFVLNLNNKIEISSWEGWENFNYRKRAVCKNGWALIYLRNELRTRELSELAVKQNGYLLKYVRDEFLTQELSECAVKYRYFLLEDVKQKFITPKLFKYAIKQNIHVLELIQDKLTPEFCELAVKQNSVSLLYLGNKLTLELCIVAVKKDPNAIQFVNKKFLTSEVMYYASTRYQVSSFLENRFESFFRVFS